MPPKRRRYFWQKKKKPSSVPSLLVLGGVVMTALLITFVLQQTLPRRESVGEKLPPPDFAGLLPPGSAAAAGATLELPDLPQSSYVAAFANEGGDPSLALIVWDKRANKYKLASTLGLSVGDIRLGGVPTLTAESLGRGAPTAIIARGPAGAYTDGVFVIVRQGDSLSFVAKHNADATTGIAYFPLGASVRHGEELHFGDVDGDGDKEAVQTSSDTDEDGKKAETVSVYAWIDGYFSYNQDLSWALTMSKSVFPEPEAPPYELAP